jgi:hypothetical protein
MNSLTDLREAVDVVIGVDTHVHTHSAAVVDTATGGVLDEITVEATAEGYAELVEFADNYPMLWAWAMEGTGGHGAGLSRLLLESSEIVIELDRSAIHASTEAQQQVFSLVIAAPEPIRARFRGQKLAAMLNTAANLRVHASWDTETTSTVVALRTLARRAHALLKEARELQKAIVAIIRSWRPDLLEEFGVGPIVAATVLCAWSHPGRIHSEARSRCSPAWHPSRPTAVRSPPGIGSIVTAIASSTTHCTPWSRAGSSTSQPPATTSLAVLPKARPVERSNAALPATSPATSIACSKAGPQLLDEA